MQNHSNDVFSWKTKILWFGTFFVVAVQKHRFFCNTTLNRKFEICLKLNNGKKYNNTEMKQIFPFSIVGRKVFHQHMSELCEHQRIHNCRWYLFMRTMLYNKYYSSKSPITEFVSLTQEKKNSILCVCFLTSFFFILFGNTGIMAAQ